MLDSLAQVTYTTTTNDGDGTLFALGALALLFWALIVLPVVIFSIVSLWRVFEKAGQEGWKSIIPFYNYWVMAEISGKPGWWGLAPLLGVIPVFGVVIALVIAVIISIELAKSFGKDPVFGLLIAFVGPVGIGILAFGKAKYVGPGGVSSGSAKTAKSRAA